MHARETFVAMVFNSMQGYKQKRGFIIAQAPMSNTTGEFWKMVHEREVAVIVMLSEFYEDGKVKLVSQIIIRAI